MSLSARRAWIKYSIDYIIDYATDVALRKESVDRKFSMLPRCRSRQPVALRKESVDRNVNTASNNIKSH